MTSFRLGAGLRIALPGAGLAAMLGWSTQTVAAPPAPVRPLYAEQVGVVDASYIKDGARVLARVTEDWTYEGCHLRPGAVLEGRVLQLVRRSRTEKTSSLQLAFERAGCNNLPSVAFRMTVVALIGPVPGSAGYDSFGMAEAAPLADAPGLSNAGTNAATPGAALSLMRSISSGSARNDYAPLGQTNRKLPAQILSGQVIDVPHTELSVGAGVEGASILHAFKKDVRLEPKTVFLLIPTALLTKEPANPGEPALHPIAEHPAHTTFAPASPPKAVDQPAVPLIPAIPPDQFEDQTEICTGTCSVLGSIDARAAGASAVVATLPIQQFGYAPHDKRRAVSFDHETALTYLDEHHLLCTFDPHRLRARSLDDTDAIRSIRAILIDPTTRHIDRVLEWRVRGGDAYLWRIGQGRILVHMGHELRLFDGLLKPLKAIPVSGRVAWVVSSPSSDHIAVAVVRERYSAAVYRELQDAAEKPDEDLEVRVYDQQLDLLSASVRGAETAPPVLSDTGELRVLHVKPGRWKITEYGWDRAEHPVAEVKSTCRPLLSAPDHGLIFVTGCMAMTHGTWYRMLRPDGKPLLKGESPMDEVGQSAEGAVGGSFAVRVLKANGSMNVDEGFNRADLKREEIAIYRSSDGAHLSSVVTDDFILAQSSYTLSPAGDQMAVVGKDSILFYALGTRR